MTSDLFSWNGEKLPESNKNFIQTNATNTSNCDNSFNKKSVMWLLWYLDVSPSVIFYLFNVTASFTNYHSNSHIRDNNFHLKFTTKHINLKTCIESFKKFTKKRKNVFIWRYMHIHKGSQDWQHVMLDKNLTPHRGDAIFEPIEWINDLMPVSTNMAIWTNGCKESSLIQENRGEPNKKQRTRIIVTAMYEIKIQ